MSGEASDYLAYERALADQYADQSNQEIETYLQASRGAYYYFRGSEVLTGLVTAIALYKGEYLLAGLAGTVTTGIEVACHTGKRAMYMCHDELLRRSRQEEV